MLHFSLQKKLKDSLGEMPLAVEVSIPEGAVVSFFGPSGSGKTSLLRMIAGLLQPDAGSIKIDQHFWYEAKQGISTNVRDRGVGFLFQDYALFPHMTVRQNLTYALKKGQTAAVIDELIDLTSLGQLVDRMPTTLSGGQQQRVALARALVQRPRLLLLDEPFSALDHTTRQQMQSLLLDVHRQLGLTIVLVSHDIAEVIRLSQYVYVLERGRVVSHGKPLKIFGQKGTGAQFQVVGNLIEKHRQDFMYILTILIGKQVVRLVVTDDEGADLEIGDHVQVISKAFNPIIRKIDE